MRKRITICAQAFDLPWSITFTWAQRASVDQWNALIQNPFLFTAKSLVWPSKCKPPSSPVTGSAQAAGRARDCGTPRGVVARRLGSRLPGARQRGANRAVRPSRSAPAPFELPFSEPSALGLRSSVPVVYPARWNVEFRGGDQSKC